MPQPDLAVGARAPLNAAKAWRFSTESLPPGERRQAWRQAMARLRLPLGETPAAEPFEGAVCCLTSPMGMDFALITARAQTICGRNPDQPAAVWLLLLLEGEAKLSVGETTFALKPDDIAYGPTGADATLRMSGCFRLLFITAPRVALDHRLIAPLSLRVGRLSGASGLGHIFSGLLHATADSLDELTYGQLRPVELALTEFLVANLAAEQGPASLGGARAARAAHLHRIRQTTETLLAEPDLTLGRVAGADGISRRYLQKLFSQAGESFSGYLRGRRLERCRLDLTSPVCANLSITEICFRWGFNCAAHFSRAFKSRYGVSPRDYRKGLPAV